MMVVPFVIVLLVIGGDHGNCCPKGTRKSCQKGQPVMVARCRSQTHMCHGSKKVSSTFMIFHQQFFDLMMVVPKVIEKLSFLTII